MQLNSENDYDISDHVLMMETSVMSMVKCVVIVGDFSLFLHGKRSLCTNEIKSQVYRGDMGSPLVSSKSEELIGIVSWFARKEGKPDIYTSVFSYNEWIQSTINSYEHVRALDEYLIDSIKLKSELEENKLIFKHDISLVTGMLNDENEELITEQPLQLIKQEEEKEEGDEFWENDEITEPDVNELIKESRIFEASNNFQDFLEFYLNE